MKKTVSKIRREESVELTREAITLAAMHCFIEKGFHQASMRDIATLAQVSVGNLYNHFSSKDALIAEIAQFEMLELAPLLVSLEGADSVDALIAFAESYLALTMNPDHLMLSAEVIAESARNPSLASLFAANHRELVDALNKVIGAGIQAGRIKPLPIEATAILILDAIEGHALRTFLFTGKKPLRKKKDGDLVQLLRTLLQA